MGFEWPGLTLPDFECPEPAQTNFTFKLKIGGMTLEDYILDENIYIL